MMTSSSRVALFCCFVSLLTGAAFAQESLIVGANVNMVSGDSFPNGDPFQRQQNEPSVAFSSRNSLHLLAGANDYRAVDVPGLPSGRETGDSWLSYFWSTNGGATWKSTLIPGYPQDPACLGADAPTLCGYAAGADPVVRAGVNGMFYYSGIVFERADPSRSAIFVSRFIDLNNDEGGDPIRFIDTTIIDANNNGAEFLDKSWIGVDIPRDNITETFSVVQSDDSAVDQTVECGNVYVGYAAISGEDENLRSEIRLAASADCGNSWDIQPISQPDSLNQGANIAIHPLTGQLHVAWRRFDTVESFLGISPTGCPARSPAWMANNDWPVATIDLGGITYTAQEARDLLRMKHRGDESIKLARRVVAAKLNLLTGGGDAVNGFDPWQWSQDLNSLIDDAEAWFVDNPVGSRPKQQAKKDGMNIKKAIQRITLGSGVCSGTETTTTTTGETNAIMVASSLDSGANFSAPVVIDESSTFDQGSTRFSFRTTAYPTIAADADGRIYVAWAARGYASIRGAPSDGDARIVVSTSTNGLGWSAPYAIDEPNREGHQIKPSLLFAGGQLSMVYYDFRQDVSNIFEGFVIDLPEANRLRHTVDVRVASALPDAAPTFTNYSLTSSTEPEPINPSGSASRYSFIAYGDVSSGETLQVEYMVPNFPMFADGTTPFIGDYVDIAAPNLINDDGTWRFASNPGDVQVWQAVWSDNRDVIPPPDGDWSKYVAPIPVAQPSLFDPTVIIPSCYDVSFPESDYPEGSLYTGTRNQNIYSASISSGVIVAAPGNNRPLGGFDMNGAPLERGFVIYVQNTTAQAREFSLSLPTTLAGVDVSFAPNQVLTQTNIEIPPYSSAVATVFASGSPGVAIPVSVDEVGGTLTGSVYLNNDPAAPDPLETSLLTAEVHNPAILNPAVLNPAILNSSVSNDDYLACAFGDAAEPCVLTPAVLNPAVLNPAVLNPAVFNPAVLNPAVFNPAVLNPAVFNSDIYNPAVLNPAVMNPAVLNPAVLNPAVFNPAIFNPAVLNPAVLNPAVLNPAVLNPAILNPAVLNPAILNPAVLNPAILNPAVLNSSLTTEPQQVDVTFTVRNDGTATTAYDLNLAAPQLEGLDYGLIVYRLNETPVAQGCELTTEAQQQLIFNQTDPLNNDVDGSFYLEPDEQVLVTFRVQTDVNSPTPADPVDTFVVEDLGGLVTSQPLNTDPMTQPPADDFGPPIIIQPTLTNTDFESISGGGTFPAATDWNGNTQTALHSGFGPGNPGSPDLGLRFGFNGNTSTAASSQTTRPFEANTTYTFKGWSTDSDLSVDSSNIQFSIGYLDGMGVFQSLADSTYDTDGFNTWQLLPGVTYTTGASGVELGQNITVQIQAVYPSFNVGVWFDNLELSTSCNIAGDWSGTFVQGAATYPLVVTNLGCATPGSVIAEVEYTSLNCSGSWTLDAIVGDTLQVSESLNNPSSCQTGWQYDVTLNSGMLSGVSTNFSGNFALSPTISSNFVANTDGWSIVNDGGGWVSAGGNPLGYLEGTDSGAATGSTAWYFGAPDKFLGDQSALYGGQLTYDLQQSDNAPTVTTQPWVVLRGAGIALVYDATASGLPGIGWTPTAVPLDAASPGWHIATDGCWLVSIVSPSACNFSGPAPSPAQFTSVLSSLDTLLIRGEYSIQFDTGGLDNVVLTDEPPPPPPVTTPVITAITPDPMSPGFGQLVTFTIANAPGLVRNVDTVWARNDVTGFVASTTNFVFTGTTVRLDGALRPTSGTEAGTVWVEYGNGDRSNDFAMTFRSTPAAPIINSVSTAGACNDYTGTEIDPLTDTVIAGDYLRVDAQGLDTNTSRVDVRTDQNGVISTYTLSSVCPGTNGSSYFVQIPVGVNANPFTLEIRANQTNVGGGPGDYAVIPLNQ